MEQRKSSAEGSSGTAATTPVLPPWMRRATPYAPDRRARMLEHMARARSLPQPQAATAPTATAPSGTSNKDIFGDAFGHLVLFGFIAILFQSRIPLCIGAFLYCTDGERIELALGRIGIRFEPDTVGPDFIKAFVSLFGWFALLASVAASVPVWLARWMPPAESSWLFIAGIALTLAIIEALASLAMRHVLPWFGWKSRPSSLICSTIKLVMAIGVLALLVLLASL